MKKINLFGIIAFIAIIGLSLTVCENEETEINPCANGHFFSNWIEPTCTIAGNSVRNCINCTETDTRSTGYSVLGHDETGAVPTCTTNKVCARISCNHVLETAIGHDETGAVATCTTDQVCARTSCNHVIKTALGHDIIENWIVTNITYPATSTAECTRSGIVTRNAQIGDTGPGGGIIFYVADGQDSRTLGFTVEAYTGSSGSFDAYTAYYLEVAPNDSGSFIWGVFGDDTLINGVTTFTSSTHTDAKKIGNGRKDTQFIIAHFEEMSITNRAAQVAGAANFNSKNDWFLPSSGELDLLYNQRNVEGINITSGWYWSSSQGNPTDVWTRFFVNGAWHLGGKMYLLNIVRAIRAF